jgi:amino acid transporter
VATRKEVQQLGGEGLLAETLGYAIKRRLLGPPLVNEQLTEQRLSKPLALGVLSPDGISSSAYGTEEILIALLPAAGLAAFSLILPFTVVILIVMALVVLSYREVVMIYIRPAGSYVVARENFGPRVAQVAAVALLIDYVVTVAVQTAAGTAAVVSAVPSLGRFSLAITIGVVVLMAYGNLRGIREAGRQFAVPTYVFSVSVILMIVVGLIREVFGNLHPYNPHALPDTYKIGSGTGALLTFAMIFTFLRAFANGGASLTGIEAVSDAVGAFRPPEGRNARRVLVAEGCILGFLVAGISWMAHVTHATPRLSGYPTVLAQEASKIFGKSLVGVALFFLVQAATALILYTGGNTSFNGFPFLASYVAGDAFLPRWLLKRGHRLVFSNAIVVLAVLSIALLIIRGAHVNDLVPLYAIGVFTAFTMAGFGMARYHHKHREAGWRRKLVTNGAAGVLTAIVVVIFAVVKFTEGAWLVLVLFAIGVPALIRLNRQYTMEAHVLEHIGTRDKPQEPPTPPTYSRRTVYVFIDEFDLATLAGLRYARSLRPTSLRAVHFVLDNVQAARLRDEWLRANTGVALDLVDCPDRRVARAAAELVQAEALLPGVGVTAVLPRRGYSPWLGRLLHDRTADQIASVVSQIPHAAATIVPFDVRHRVESLVARDNEHAAALTGRRAAPSTESAAPDVAPTTDGSAAAREPSSPPDAPIPAEPTLSPVPGRDGSDYNRPPPPPDVTPIGRLPARGKAVVEGRVHAVEIRPVEQNTVLAAEIIDATGELTVLFYGRTHIPGLDPGAKVRFTGRVSVRENEPVMINPAYELLAPGPHHRR